MLSPYEYKAVVTTAGHKPVVFDHDQIRELSYVTSLNTIQADNSIVLLPGRLSGIEPWATAIQVFRNGVEVVGGPVRRVRGEYGAMQITFCDAGIWLTRRFVHTEHNYEHVSRQLDTSLAFKELAEDALSPDARGIRVLASPCGQVYKQNIPAYTNFSDLIGGFVKDVDYLAEGHTIHVGGAELFGMRRLSLTDDAWQAPELLAVELDGSDMVTRLIVQGTYQGNAATEVLNPTIFRDGAAGGGRYGLHERRINNVEFFRVGDIDTFYGDTFARLNAPKALVLSKTPLNPHTNIDFADLTPGARARISLTGTSMPFEGWLRLDTLRVSLDAFGIETLNPDFTDIGVSVDTRGNAMRYTQAVGGI